MEFTHIPVLLSDVLEALSIRPNGVYIDGTVGGAGHSLEIAKRITTGRLLCVDQDPDAIQTSWERLNSYDFVRFYQGNYSEIDHAAQENKITKADGILLDLGVSSYQLDNSERGFSYNADAKLDMRMSKSGTSAYDLINGLSEQALSQILWKYGEEKMASRIAREIVKKREEHPIETTLQLAELVKQAVPAAVRREKNPCKKTFQAIRIAVNDEFSHLLVGLEKAFDLLVPGGRLAVITFHSLEDRLVKNTFREYEKGCECPSDFPVCVCGKTPKGKLVHRKPIAAAPDEMESNRRSRSARLHTIEKIKDE